MNGAIARIVLRYGVGGIIGWQAGNMLAGDPDIVMFVALGVGCATEAVYTYAKRKGWTL